MELNNREIAVLAWLIFSIGLLTWKLRPSKSLLRLFRTLGSRPILILFGLMSFYIACNVWLLWKLGWWDWSNLKTTMTWVLGFAFVTLMQINKAGKEDSFFRKTLLDSINTNVIIAFIGSLYVFSLPIELVLVPIALLLTIIAAVSENDKKLSSAHVLATSLLVIAGIIVIGHSLYRITTDFGGFATSHTAREFTSPVLLTILFLPFLYALHLYMTYENAFRRLKFSIRNQAVQQHAARRIIPAFHIDLDGLRKWLRHIALFRPENISDVDLSIAEIKKVRKRERNPYKVPPLIGWPPEHARALLKDFGLATNDYHRTHDGWYASSPYLKLGGSILDNTVAYYIEGEEFAVMQLKLVLDVNDPSAAAFAHDQFGSISSALVAAAVQDVSGLIETCALTENEPPLLIRGKEVRLTRENWVDRIDGGYELALTISARPRSAH